MTRLTIARVEPPRSVFGAPGTFAIVLMNRARMSQLLPKPGGKTSVGGAVGVDV